MTIERVGPGAADEEVRYLVFTVGPERYALPITRVANVQIAGPIARVPGATPYVRGVMNLRGTLLTVVDLASMLGLPGIRGQGHVAVVRDGEREAGLLVGEVEEIVSLDPGSAEPRLSTLPAERGEFLEGQVRRGPHLIGLLRLGRVLDTAQHG